VTTASGVSTTRVAIVADDLIWSTRLAALVQGSGAEPVPVRSSAALEAAFDDGVDRAIVDLTARAYDPLAAIALAAAAGAPVLAVGPHDDRDARKAALAAGAARVLAYRKLADDGPATVAAWLGTAAPAWSVGATRS
jgi:DNA-binding response OmpR family regulator